MQDNLFERDVDPVDAVMERQASISDELTPQERLWLSKNHTVRVGVNPDFYPLEKFDAEGRYTGIGPDYLRILHKMTGLSFRIAPPSDWTNTIDMATSPTRWTCTSPPPRRSTAPNICCSRPPISCCPASS